MIRGFLKTLLLVLVVSTSGCRFFSFSAKSKLLDEVEGPIKERNLGRNFKIDEATVLFEGDLPMSANKDRTFQKVWHVHVVGFNPDIGAAITVGYCIGIFSDKKVEYYRVMSVSACPEKISEKELSEAKVVFQKMIDDFEKTAK